MSNFLPEAPKRRKPRPPKTKPGEPITLYRLMAMIKEFNTTGRSHHTHGFSLYIRRGTHADDPMFKHAALLWVMKRTFQTVLNWALEGRIYTCEYLESEPRCRCADCDRERVKNPRGPKKKPDGTYTGNYRGAMSFSEVQKLYRGETK